MDRRAFLLGSIVVVTAPQVAGAQHTRKPTRLGQLMPGPAGCYGYLRATEQALRDGLKNAGYVVDRTIIIERRCFERPELAVPVAKELVSRDVDVLVVWSTPGALAAMQVTKTTPIVFIDPSNPLGGGLIRSFAQPGGNATGLSSNTVDIAARRLELLREAVPKAQRVAALTNPASTTSPLQVEGFKAAVNKLHMSLSTVNAATEAELGPAFTKIERERADVLIVVADTFFFVKQQRIVELANRSGLPAMYSHIDFVRSGGLIAYAADLIDMSRRAASYVDKIIRGSKAADIPVEQPTKFELAVNLKTAKALGLTIPPSLLLRADQVIE